MKVFFLWKLFVKEPLVIRVSVEKDELVGAHNDLLA